MRYAICNETFGERPLAKACDFAAECGYTGLEVARFTLASLVTDLSDAQRGEIRRTIARAGLDCIGLHWLLAKTGGFHVAHPDAAVRQRTINYLAELARLCHNLGGRVLVFGSPKQRSLLPGVSHTEAKNWIYEAFSKLAPVLETTDAVVALEPLSPAETDVITTAADACQLIDRIGSPRIRLHLDVKAMASELRPFPEIIHSSARHLEHFHANDENLQGPGFGAINFLPIFRSLDDVRYAGWVSVEVFDYSRGPERLACDSIAYMRCIEAELG